MSYIVGISGVRGAGKSTLARRLSVELEADTIVIGRLRDSLRAVYHSSDHPEFFQSITNSHSLDDAVRILNAQALLLHGLIAPVIERSRKEGINLILDGGQITPDLYGGYLDLHLMLYAPESCLGDRMRSGKDRNVTDKSVEMNLRIQRYLIEQALANRISAIETRTVEQTLNDASALILPKRGITY